MPYCSVDDTSIVAMSRASAEAAPAHAVGALFCSKQCGVSFGAFSFFLQRSMFMLLPFLFFLLFWEVFSVRCDSQQVGDTCAKSFTNNSSRFG